MTNASFGVDRRRALALGGSTFAALSVGAWPQGAMAQARALRAGIRRLTTLDETELFVAAKELRAPHDLVAEVAHAGRLPVVLFTAGGIATPADAALLMQLGCDGVFVGSGIFKSGDPRRRAEAIVQAVAHFRDPKVLAAASEGLGEAMVGRGVSTMKEEEKLATRGW